MKLYWYLVRLVLGLLLPAILLVASLGTFLVLRERNAVEAGIAHTVQAMSLSVDARLGATIDALMNLATSQRVGGDDPRALEAQLAESPFVRPHWDRVSLLAADGHLLFTAAAGDAVDPALLTPVGPDPVATAIATRRPAVGVLAVSGDQTQQVLLPVAVPVLRGGAVRYVLLAHYRGTDLSPIFARQALDPEWLGVVFGPDGMILARSRGEDWIGDRARGAFLDQLSSSDHGRTTGVSKDGVRSIGAFVHSPLTGWAVLVSAPEHVLLAPARMLGWVVGIGAVCLLSIGIAVAVLLGRRLSGEIRDLGVMAHALGQGRPLPQLRTARLVETRRLRAELESAAALLQQRQHEREAAEAQLASSEAQYRRVVELARELLWIHTDDVIHFANPSAAAALGYGTPDALIGRNSLSLIHPDDLALAQERTRRMRGTGQAVPPVEMQLRRADGSPLLVEIQAVPFTEDGGRTILVMAHDISQRRQAEAALRLSEDLHRRVVEMAQDIIWIHVDGKIVSANPYGAQLLGLASPADLIGRSYRSFLHPDDWAQADGRTRLVQSGGTTPRPAEMRMMRTDGTERLVEWQGVPFEQNGKRAVLAIGHDVTQRKEAERALRASEQRFREFAEAASDWLWEAGPDLRVTYSSRADSDPDAAAFVGRSIADVLVQDATLDKDQYLEDLRLRRPIRDVRYAFGSAGGLRHVRISGRATFDEAGTFTGYRGVARDVTAVVETEARLRQAQRMEAVGQLTGGIAHDFNNLLAVIIGNSEMLLETQGPVETGPGSPLSMIEQAALRGAELTRRLLAFSRQQALRPRVLDVNQLVEGVKPLLVRSLGETIQIDSVLGRDTWPILADAGQLENCLLNLAVNARDAMPKGGRLTIATRNILLDASDATAMDQELEPGPYVMLAVSDTGTGMAPEVLKRIFEPFFTTKEQGKGTGLGLSMVYGFVKQSGGHISVHSEVGLGTTVKICLPRAGGASRAVEVAEEEPLARSRGETLLVVEDDGNVRGVLTGMLQGLGYRVIEAQDVPSALRALDGGAAFDLILSDIVMPGGLDGWDLAQRVWQREPGFPVLFMTGYTDSPALAKVRAGRPGHLVTKPFRQRDLANALRACLEPGRAAA